MKIIDCTGMNCPEPVLRTKEILELGQDKSFEIIVDNEASRDNVVRFLRSRKCDIESLAKDNEVYRIICLSNELVSDEQSFDADEYNCEINEKNTIYIISSDSMGGGDGELGWALLQTYIKTIVEVKPLPSHIIFYNGGVKLVATESKALEAIKQLQQNGVKILSCGTCLEFFKLEQELQVGETTNMYEILDISSKANKVLTP